MTVGILTIKNMMTNNMIPAMMVVMLIVKTLFMMLMKNSPLVHLWPPGVLPQPNLSRVWQEDQQEQSRGGDHASLPLRAPCP